MINMKKLILNTLQFNTSVPTPYVFMKRFLKAANADKQPKPHSPTMKEYFSYCYKLFSIQMSIGRLQLMWLYVARNSFLSLLKVITTVHKNPLNTVHRSLMRRRLQRSLNT